MSFSMNPHALGLPSLHGDHWDPFWAACDETDTVVTIAHRLGRWGGFRPRLMRR